MERLIELNAKLKSLLAHGRASNPFYSESSKIGTRKLTGLTRTRKVALRDIVSPQATIHESKVKAMVRGIKAGKESNSLPTLQHRGHGKYAVMDGNHRTTAHLWAGKRKVEAFVQR
jgi:uncharacterized ParB-like nuclease family protein